MLRAWRSESIFLFKRAFGALRGMREWGVGWVVTHLPGNNKRDRGKKISYAGVLVVSPRSPNKRLESVCLQVRISFALIYLCFS